MQLRLMEASDRNRLQSYAMQKILENDREAKEQKIMIEKQRQEMIDKKKQYADKVKDLHKPQISEKKRLELQLLKENLKHPVRQPKRPKSDEMKKARVPHFKKDDLHSEAESAQSMNPPKKKKKKLAPLRNQSLQPKEPERKKPVDYLQELKNQRMKKLEESGVDAMHQSRMAQAGDWGHALRDQKLSMKEKYDRVTAAAKQIEQQAGRMEEIERFAKNGSIDNTEDINERYVEAIRAKLALLENL